MAEFLHPADLANEPDIDEGDGEGEGDEMSDDPDAHSRKCNFLRYLGEFVY